MSDPDPVALAMGGVLVSLLNKLEEKGVFSPLEIRELLDMALAALEHSGLRGEVVDEARKHLDRMIASFSPDTPSESGEHR